MTRFARKWKPSQNLLWSVKQFKDHRVFPIGFFGHLAKMNFLPFTRIRYENDTLFCNRWRVLRENFWPKFWAPSARTARGIPKFSRNRVRNRSDFCQPFLTKIDTILGQLGSINLPEIGQIFVLQFAKNRLNFCQPPVPKKCQLWGTRFAGTRFHRDCSAVPRVPVPDGVRLFLTIMG